MNEEPGDLARRAKVLVVDDDPIFSAVMSDLLTELGHYSQVCRRIDQCREALGSRTFDLLLLDVGLPDGSGLDVLPWIRKNPDSPEIIIITGEGDAAGAELALKSGVWDYLQKTDVWQRIQLAISRALEHRQARRSRHWVKALNRPGIVGESVKIKESIDLLAKAAATDYNVLVTGETGTGKELFAQAIHLNSVRSNKPLVTVDCTSIHEDLAKSELFGHKRGAFTGAEQSFEGLIKSADGGTLFLDEVGELPPHLQKTFLRVLQNRSFRPVGGIKEVEIDFRLIAATNQDIDLLVKDGGFRGDLFFRLQSLRIHLPSLRERREDIPTLVQHYLTRLSQKRQVAKAVSPEFLEALASYEWPGNVRELVHAVESAVAMSLGQPLLLVQHLPLMIRIAWTRRGIDSGADSKEKESAITSSSSDFPRLRDYRRRMDAEYLKELIKFTNRDMNEASKIAGVSVSRLYGLLRECGLNDPS
ncbi:MAG: sigma-54 dependent transcriptional regulator [Thermodesulfobacteriota bacterium]